MLKEIVFVSSVVLVGQVLAHNGSANTSERPEGAPVISEVVHDRDWYVQAFHGVSKPYPYSFNFIKNQGNWYTPFNEAGMLPPYDIRDWHK
ncbi:MAG: hypothetical protein FE834_02120 [Gammaproteobacteria bacterium]|nr:hypothetical protein [Gammaproteobacteria bacterium]